MRILAQNSPEGWPISPSASVQEYELFNFLPVPLEDRTKPLQEDWRRQTLASDHLPNILVGTSQPYGGHLLGQPRFCQTISQFFGEETESFHADPRSGPR